MFAYCENNPVMFVDPNGTIAIEGAAAALLWLLKIVGTYILAHFTVNVVIPAIGELISDVVEGVETIVTTISSNLEDSKAEEKDKTITAQKKKFIITSQI